MDAGGGRPRVQSDRRHGHMAAWWCCPDPLRWASRRSSDACVSRYPTCTACRVTTRAPRPGEVDGVDYRSSARYREFQQLIDR